MNRIKVMHIVDTLIAGGMERMAVNLVNFLPRERYTPYLCTTRKEGPLAHVLAPDVRRIRLDRRRRFDIGALRRLVICMQAHNVQILHAHNYSLFIAAVASFFPPYPALLWHHHYNVQDIEEYPVWLYWPAARRVSGVIACNQQLAEWSQRRLRVPPERVWYIPNFVHGPEFNGKPPPLPGTTGGRVVCVANFRSPKDHLTLLRAMALVIRRMPTAHLLLVGTSLDVAYSDLIRREIAQHSLDHNVSLLGQRLDVFTLLKACDIGVLSSVSEGFPMVLLEYGAVGLPTVATSVGQCAEVLDEGRAGILVPPGSPYELAEAILSLLKSPEQRAALGTKLRCRVENVYSSSAIMEQVCRVYDTVLSRRKGISPVS